MALILLGLNRLNGYRNGLLAGEAWSKVQEIRRNELGGKTVGIVGLGAVGTRTAELLQPFDVELLVCDPYVSDERLARVSAKQVDLKELFSRCQVITVHSGLTDETRGMIGADELALIQDNAIFVNTSRAEVIDHKALLTELSKKRFWAALDVVPGDELPANDPLRKLDHVFVTPHVAGGFSQDTWVRNSRTVVSDVTAVLEGRQPENLITPEIYANMT